MKRCGNFRHAARWWLLAVFVAAGFWARPALSAEPLAYDLEPLAVAADTYMFLGEQTDFTPDNGGNMANSGFIITGLGVVVIDTGLTRLFAPELPEGQAAIEAIGAYLRERLA